MPKQNKSESVLHDWVHELSFQQQALLLTGIRGADGTSKHNPAKEMTRYLRGVVLKPAGNWSGFNDNDFMWGDYSQFHKSATAFFKDHDTYPHHFILHLIHCAEVIAYKHPDSNVRHFWWTFYFNMTSSMHMGYETEFAMDLRLSDFGCGWHNEKEVVNA
jgi:hypothetical protein